MHSNSMQPLDSVHFEYAHLFPSDSDAGLLMVIGTLQ